MPPRVLLVNMPFASLRWPNLGPSLLKAALARRSIGCDVAYFNVDFAERIGLERYTWIADHFAFVLGGERLFAKAYFDTGLPDDQCYYRDVLLPADAGFSADDRRDYEETARHVEPFLDHCLGTIDWSRYAVVGFATSFQQTMASMCLARRIKRTRPEVVIAMGGAACEGEMGVELARQFAEVDYVFLGEADHAFADVVEAILAGGPRVPPVTLPAGVVRRASADTRSPNSLATKHPACLTAAELDALPHPDFDDYFARLRRSPLAPDVDPLLFFETSRGCWWGEKHQCHFCGLNGSRITYRSKSPRRAVDELRYLVERHGIHRACSADNILDHRYFTTLLPMLEAAKLDLAFVYEMKTNLTRAQVDALLRAGLGAAQLGIETFIPAVLRHIGKGTTAAHSVQTLKWFSAAGIEVKWNLLYGFPGEKPEDYAAMAKLLPSLVHLAPPLAVGRVRLDRFSPYFDDPTAHGMSNPRPHGAFAHVFPFAPGVLARLAYYYEYDYADGRNPMDYVGPVLEAVERWRELSGTVTLRMADRPEGVLILHDTRPGATEFQRRLVGIERAVYHFCDTARSPAAIGRFVAEHSDGKAVDPAALRRMLDEWVASRIMARLDARYVSLALGVT